MYCKVGISAPSWLSPLSF